MPWLVCLGLMAITPVQAGSNAAVVLEVEHQAGSAYLEWDLLDASTGPPPIIDAWLVAKSTDGGPPVIMVLPATATSYNDLDVAPGHIYSYTVKFQEGADEGLQSNPVFFTKNCPLIIIRCIPVDPLPFPSVKTECLCI